MFGESTSSGNWPQFVESMRFLGFKIDIVDENVLFDSCFNDAFFGKRLNDAMIGGVFTI
jgi:hypothetical protein